MFILSKLIHSQWILIKFSKKFMKVEKLILKFFFKCKEQKLVKAIMKKHKVEDLDPREQACYKQIW